MERFTRPVPRLKKIGLVAIRSISSNTGRTAVGRP
jgi:hypothetical protein